jgi:hypothetical protein
MDYDCIVFDTAPTGHTLRLLQFPAMLEKGLAKLMALRGALGGALSQIGALLGADLETMQAQLVGRLEELKARAACLRASRMLPSESRFPLPSDSRVVLSHARHTSAAFLGRPVLLLSSQETAMCQSGCDVHACLDPCIACGRGGAEASSSWVLDRLFVAGSRV